MGVKLAPILIMAFVVVPIPGSTTQPPRNAAAEALEWCRVTAADASTAWQTDSEASPVRSCRQLPNSAFAALMRWLPAAAADRPRRSQWARFAYRDADGATRSVFYASEEGTMFVPMAHNAVTVVRDRANLLERYTQKLDIA